jgi:hypothetical protein
MIIGNKMIAVFTSPRKAFEAVAEKPDWLAPMIVSVLIGILFALTVVPAVVMPATMEKTMEQMRDRGVPEDKIEEAMKFMAGPLPVVFGVVGVMLATPINLLIISGILFGLSALFGGKARFAQVFSAATYSGLILSLGTILKGVLMYVQRSIHAGTSLALILPEDMRENFLYRFLGQFDLFTLWQLGILSIGLGVIYCWKTAKSAGMVFGLWLLWALLSSILGGVMHFGAA